MSASGHRLFHNHAAALEHGAPLPADLPRVSFQCGRGHTSDALFCQPCGTRLVTG